MFLIYLSFGVRSGVWAHMEKSTYLYSLEAPERAGVGAESTYAYIGFLNMNELELVRPQAGDHLHVKLQLDHVEDQHNIPGN